MPSKREKRVKQTNGKVPGGCSKCKCAFNPDAWMRSDWTLTGWSPWCPQCHTDFAHENEFRFNNQRAKPGPKPRPKLALPEERPSRVRGAARFQRAKTHCPQGHEYDEANTYFDKRGGRVCRTCRRASVKKSKARERGESV